MLGRPTLRLDVNMKISKRKNNKDDGKKAFQKVTSVLKEVLGRASNMVCNRKLLSDTAAVTIKAASSRSSIHGARKRMKRGKSRRQIARVLEGLDLKKVEDETNAVLRDGVRKDFGGQILDAAIDIHAVPYHGGPHERKEEIGRSKPKDGTTKFHMIATAYLVGKRGKRFTMAVTFVSLGTSMRSVVQELLYLLKRCGITIRRLLLDRGFYAIDVVKLLMRLNIGFIIPMRGGRLKKKRGSYSTAYTMKSTKDGKSVSQLVNAVSVIKYNKGKRFKHHGAMQLCFITYRIDIDPRRIAEFYRKRFGIESSYKLNKAIRPRTSSRNPAIRMFLFGAAAIIQNIWVEIKLVFCRNVAKTSRWMVTQHDFVDILLHWVRKLYGEEVRLEKHK